MVISDSGRGLVRRLGVTAAAVFALAAVSQQRAEAVSLSSPGVAAAAKSATDALTTEVRHGGRGHGGGGFRGGGFHGGHGGFRGGTAFHGGHVFRGGGYRVAPVFHGGYRHSYRHAYHRPHFHHHHRPYFHRRVYYAPGYYGYPRHYAPRHRYCRVIWTHYGPRKICKHRPFYRHHWRHRYYGW